MNITHLVLAAPVNSGLEDPRSIVAAWNRHKDFRNKTIGVRGSYANREDVERYMPQVTSVEIRFNQDVDLVVVNKIEDGMWEEVK